MSERSHVHPVFLPVELYVAISKAMADLEIGKSSAILLMIAEGLHSRGFLSREDYEVLRKKYERKLVEIVRRGDEPLTKEQLEKEKKLKDLEKQFSMVIEQWDLHPSLEWRLRWVKKAKEWKDKIPSAKALLDLADKEVVPSE